MSWPRAAGPLLACALFGCEWSAELQSDPASWTPDRVDVFAPDADESPRNDIDPACYSGVQPALDPTLQTSTATRLSHLSGVTCLEGCHAEGGEAHTTFAAAGTVYRSQTSRVFVGAGGVVHNVGGTDLPVDRCGNFYAVRGALKNGLEQTQPFVQNPTVHRMEKSLAQQNNFAMGAVIENLGSCNHGDCHDFSSKLKWGIYY